MTKAEQPTITQAQYGASYRRDLDRWVIYEQTSEGSIPFAETYGYDKERVDMVLAAFRTTSLAAQDGLVEALAVHLYEHSMSKTLGAAKLVSWSDETKAFWIERANDALSAIKGDKS